MKTSALYVRKSTQQHQENSIEVQLDAMRRYCEGYYIIDRVFEDQSSGKSVERKGLNDALGWLSSNPNRVLVFYKVDRYARTFNKFEKIRAFIEADRIKFMDVGLPREKQDLLMIQLKLAFAENESRLLGNRISATIKHLKEKKGIKWGASDETLLKARLASQEVRGKNADYFGQRLKDVISIIGNSRTQHEIAESLNQVGFLTPRGKHWSQQSLSRTLKRLKQRGIGS
jgi:DNA invertase Pin-like site-specific DNA recombinase